MNAEPSVHKPPERHAYLIGIRTQHLRRQFLRKAREKEAAESSQLVSDFEATLGAGNYAEPPMDPEQLLTFAEFNPIHGSCVEAKTVDSVGQGWTVEASEDKDPDEITKIVEGLTKELDAICPMYPFGEMLYQARWEAEAVGWSGWEVVREAKNTKSKISALYPIPAHELRAIPNKTNRSRVWAQVVDGQKRFFTVFGLDEAIDGETGQAVGADSEKRANEIIVFRRYAHSSRYYGVPKWQSCIPSMAEYGAQREYNMSLFSSSALADLLLLVKAADLKTAQALCDQLMAKLEEARGEGHYNIALASTLDTEIEKTTVSEQIGGAREASFGERREDLVKEILMAHNVPPYRVGWAQLGSLGGSTAKEMLQAYRAGSILPWQTLFEDTLRKTIFGEMGLNLAARALKWVLVEMDWEEEERKATRAEKYVKSGIDSPNDARDYLGKPRKQNPELDRHYINGLPLDTKPQTLEPGERPPRAAKPDETLPPPGGGGEGRPFDRSAELVEKIDARREDYLAPAKRLFAAHFETERDEIANVGERVETDDFAAYEEDVIAVVDGMTPQLMAAMRKLYQDVAEDFAMSTLERMAVAAQSTEPGTQAVFKRSEVLKARVPDDAIDFTDVVLGFLGSREVAIEVVHVWQEAIDAWVSRNGAEKVAMIQETTRGQIRDIIQGAIDSGESLTTTMSKIDDLYLDQIIPNRSEVIARTEIIPASNLGSQEAVRAAADAADMDIEKQWISSGNDGRTRPEHLAHDLKDKWVPLNKPHLVSYEGSQEQLMFPGDSSLGASAGNTIQCRCTEVYRVARRSSLDKR